MSAGPYLLVGIDTEGDNQWDAAAREQQRQVRGAVGIRDVDRAVTRRAHHAHLVLVVAVLARHEPAEERTRQAADHRQVLVRDEVEDRAVDRTEVLPRDVDGTVPGVMIIAFSPSK